jgi:hypothetical protein
MKKQTRPTSNISWPDVTFLAEANREPFATAQIITLYSYCLNISEEENVPLYGIRAGEHVQVFEDRVVIAIDVDTIDDEAIAQALDFLTQVDNFEVGTFKQISPKRTFNYKKLH